MGDDFSFQCVQVVVESEGVRHWACVLYAEMCPCELTGTLGSDTAMLSG